jgi:uncharacterized membrane protein
MTTLAAITVHRSREEIERLWREAHHRPSYVDAMGLAVTFKSAPGDRGTEIHVEQGHGPPGGKLGEIVRSRFGVPMRAKVKDDLRRFKQVVETGQIPRSDATPEGESAEHKLKQRPAQPLPDAEREPAGVR